LDYIPHAHQINGRGHGKGNVMNDYDLSYPLDQWLGRACNVFEKRGRTIGGNSADGQYFPRLLYQLLGRFHEILE
jgi:hypothetical protein